MNILAVIPARGGSKGIINKNLQEVCGKTLVSHALSCASRSKYWMDVVVSTDSFEILEHAKSNGYSGEYLRPKYLGEDDSSMVDVVLDVLLWAGKNGNNYDVIVLLQPTSPLRLASDIDASLDAFFAAGDAVSLISVTNMVEHPVECVTMTPNGWEYLVEPEEHSVGRQFYNKNHFFINGAIYICTSNFLVQSKGFIDHKNSILYEMPRSRSIDIDTDEDLMIANCLCKKSLEV